MTHENVGLEPIATKRGRIVRVKMTDFVTYENVETFPGKALNVVIGPNGSGKSTLLSAIVLGLGGKPAVIGRSPVVQDYIKTGCKEAKVEIELEGEKKNVKVRRTIFRDGKSMWQLNDATVPFKEVEKLMKSLNIQIDNLCQVLPQDRVQDFAKMNMQQLLESTQKAVGKEGLSNIHSNLKELQKQQRNVEASLNQDRARHEQEQGHIDRLKGIVEKHERREGILRQVDVCKSKVDILTYQEKRRESISCKEQKSKHEENIRTIEAKIEPFKKHISEAQKKLNEVKNKCSGMDRKLRMAVTELEGKAKALEVKRHEILEAEVAKDSKLKNADRQREDVEKLKLKISRMRSDIASLESEQMPKLEQERKVAVLKKAVEELARKISDMKHQKVQIDANVAQENQALNEILKRLHVLENVRVTRLRCLQQNNRDAFQAANWIEENRHRFEMNVYLPMCVELSVTDPQYARYIESAIGYNDLVAFTCESKADLSLIIEELRRKQRLAINVLHADPLPDTFTPNVEISALNRICPGFRGYLKDFVSGPTTLISLLCKQKSFHLIPVGDENVNPDLVPPEITLYYTGDYRRALQKSRYTGDFIRTCDSIRQAQFLANTVDPQELEGLNQRAAIIRKSLETATEKKTQLNSQIQNLESDRNNKRNELNKIQTLQSTFETRSFQLAQKERDLKNLEKNVIDPQRVKADFITSAKELVNQLVELQEPYFESLKSIEKCVRDGQILQFAVLAASNNVKTHKQKCKKEQDALDTAKATLEELNNKYADLRTEAKTILTAFERRTQIKMADFMTQNEDVLNTLPSSVDELENHIQEKLARAEMLGGANDGVIRDYENHVRQLEDLAAAIQRKEAESLRLTNEMTERQNEWKNDLDTLVNKINDNFSKYFKSMNCAGVVELFTGNSEHDYDNYGLKVRVKFRDSDELQDLNAYIQSGGERAVTTAIYMLSLQELTPVPFRLVDEINQGMDSINERRVFELLLTSTSQPDTPQYFLLTPKLLKDMPFSDSTTVLCIINSACAPDYRHWDIAKFIQLQRGQNGIVNGHHTPNDDQDD